MRIQLSFLLAALGAVSASAKADANHPPQVALDSVSYAGTACPIGSAYASLIEPDQLVLLLDEAVIEVGPGVPQSARRRNCQLNLAIRNSPGWQYAIKAVHTIGYFDLVQGDLLTYRLTSFSSGQRAAQIFAKTLRGPLTEEFRVDLEPQSLALVWSPCNGTSSLNVQLAMTLSSAGQRSGAVMIPETEHGNRLFLDLFWHPCR